MTFFYTHLSMHDNKIVQSKQIIQQYKISLHLTMKKKLKGKETNISLPV